MLRLEVNLHVNLTGLTLGVTEHRLGLSCWRHGAISVAGCSGNKPVPFQIIVTFIRRGHSIQGLGDFRGPIDDIGAMD